MKREKTSRESFRRLVASNAVKVIEQFSPEDSVDQLLIVLTLGLATLDHYQGAHVPLGISLKGGDDEFAELTNPVTELLNEEGGHTGEPRFHSVEFWVSFIEEAETRLRGFTKRY